MCVCGLQAHLCLVGNIIWETECLKQVPSQKFLGEARRARKRKVGGDVSPEAPHC